MCAGAGGMGQPRPYGGGMSQPGSYEPSSSTYRLGNVEAMPQQMANEGGPADDPNKMQTGGDYVVNQEPGAPTNTQAPIGSSITNPQGRQPMPWERQDMPFSREGFNGAMPWMRSSGFMGNYQPPNRYSQQSQFQQPQNMQLQGRPQGGVYGPGGQQYADRWSSPRAYDSGPFVPGMGMYGPYGSPGPGGFSGSVQNGMNFINNGAGQNTMYQSQGLNQNGGAPDQNMMSFLNYLNSYGRR